MTLLRSRCMHYTQGVGEGRPDSVLVGWRPEKAGAWFQVDSRGEIRSQEFRSERKGQPTIDQPDLIL